MKKPSVISAFIVFVAVCVTAIANTNEAAGGGGGSSSVKPLAYDTAVVEVYFRSPRFIQPWGTNQGEEPQGYWKQGVRYYGVKPNNLPVGEDQGPEIADRFTWDQLQARANEVLAPLLREWEIVQGDVMALPSNREAGTFKGHEMAHDVRARAVFVLRRGRK